MDKSKIPKDIYCWDMNKGGMCPYYEEIEHMKINYSGFVYSPVINCKYLNINTAQLWLDEHYWSAYLLSDRCKICGENC